MYVYLLHYNNIVSGEEEYLTASECESDDEGILQHHSSTDDKTPSSSTTKLSLQFAIHEASFIQSQFFPFILRLFL